MYLVKSGGVCRQKQVQRMEKAQRQKVQKGQKSLHITKRTCWGHSKRRVFK